ncbi:MAG: TetR/AcrR family transcriptional regulator [Desulfovibrio sp.]|nr:TetR/AcrR family transcriptional regulator [Desulfovibrio sp.]
MRPSSKKQEILLLAAELFAERGYNAVSIRDLAKAVQMTPASLYHHFADKEQIYRETLVAIFSRISPALDLPVKDESPLEYLERLVRSIITFLMSDAIFTKLLFRELSEGNSGREIFIVNNVLKSLYNKISRGISTFVHNEDAARLSDMLISSIIGYVNMNKYFILLHQDDSYSIDCEAVTSRIMSLMSLQVPSKPHG